MIFVVAHPWYRHIYKVNTFQIIVSEIGSKAISTLTKEETCK